MNKVVVLFLFLPAVILPAFAQTSVADGPKAHISQLIPVQGGQSRAQAALRSQVVGVQKSTALSAANPNPWHLLATVPNAVIKDVSFTSPAVGYAAAELGRVFKTIDGGVTWTKVMDLGAPYYWYGVSARGNDVLVSGFINGGSNSGLLRWSHDGGVTWSDILVLDQSVAKVRFADANHGLVVSSLQYVVDGDAAYHTSNGGLAVADWVHSKPDPSGAWFGNQLSLLPTMQAAVSGINYCTSGDGGATWSCRPSIDNVFDGVVFFADKDHGWVGGGEISPNTEGWVHRTTDGGQSWSGRTLDVGMPIRQVHFLDANRGWAVGGNIAPFGFGNAVGGIFFSADGGVNWSQDVDTNAFEMDACDTVRAGGGFQVWCAGYNFSLNSSVYTVRGAVTPAPSLSAGTYVGGQTVTLTSTTPGATIYYTTDGSSPGLSSAQYNGPIPIKTTTRLRAFAGAPDYMASDEFSADYSITLPQLQVSSSTNTLTVRGGESATLQFAVSSNGAPTGPVSFACSGLPTGSQCSFTPNSVGEGSMPATVTVTIPTTSAMASQGRSRVGVAFALILPGFVLFPVRKRTALLRMSLMLVLMIVAVVLASCGGSGSSAPNPRSTTYPVTISATAAGANLGSMNLQLTVTN